MAGIVYVFQDHYPWDVRAEKIVSSVVASGLPATIVSRNRDGEPVAEEMDGYLIRRLPRGWGKFTRELLNFPAFFSPIWIATIVSAARAQSADLIMVRDLPLAPAAYWAGKIAGVPVVMDMAEDYPAMIAGVWKYDGRGPFDILVRNPKLLRKLERWILPKLDGVLVVSHASAKRIEPMLAGAGTQVEVVGNTPRIDKHLEGEESDVARMVRDLDGLKLLYVGFVTNARGISIVVRALAEIQRRIGKVSLIVVGDGYGMPDLLAEVESAGVSDSVVFAGWLEQDLVPRIVAAADICLVPHFVSPHINTTLPNKIYDYMFHSRPVIVTHSESLREIVETYDCGLWYHDRDIQGLADTVVKLADSETRAMYGARGHEAVVKHLNWDADSRLLLEFIAQIAGPGATE